MRINYKNVSAANSTHCRIRHRRNCQRWQFQVETKAMHHKYHKQPTELTHCRNTYTDNVSRLQNDNLLINQYDVTDVTQTIDQ